MRTCRIAIFVLVVFTSAGSIWAAPAPAQNPYMERIEDLRNLTQQTVSQLSQQAATVSGSELAAIEASIADVKRQGEISRLRILLEWAQADGDVARAAEVQQVLDQRLNPAQPQQLPQVPRNDAPATK